MEKTYIDIRFEGDKFSPKRLKELTGLNLKTIAQYGEIATKGRYKGLPLPYGMALLKVSYSSSKNDISEALNKYISVLLQDNKSALKKSKVDEIILDIETPSHTESALTLDTDILRKISKLNARIDLHLIKPEKDFA